MRMEEPLYCRSGRTIALELVRLERQRDRDLGQYLWAVDGWEWCFGCANWGGCQRELWWSFRVSGQLRYGPHGRGKVSGYRQLHVRRRDREVGLLVCLHSRSQDHLCNKWWASSRGMMMKGVRVRRTREKWQYDHLRTLQAELLDPIAWSSCYCCRPVEKQLFVYGCLDHVSADTCRPRSLLWAAHSHLEGHGRLEWSW